MTRRKVKAIFSIFGVVLLSLIISSAIKKSNTDIKFPEFLFGVPTYPNAKFNRQMSQTGDPYIYVFLTKDDYKKVLDFYKKKMEVDYKVLKYGRGKITNLIIYQFELKKGLIKNYLYKGVEIIPLNSFYYKVYKAWTKIKIYIPREEIYKNK